MFAPYVLQMTVYQAQGGDIGPSAYEKTMIGKIEEDCGNCGVL